MKNVTKKFVADVLSASGYTRNQDGKFQVEIHIKPEKLDWEQILSGEELPLPAYNQYLNEYKFSQHQNWAENVAQYILSTHFKTDGDRDDIAKQLITLVMSLSETVINEDDMLHESIMVNIGVDTGDSCNDYTANTVPPAYGADHSLKESEWCASIVWLTKQQGHKKGELYFALDHIQDDRESIHTQFMASIANEVWSTLSDFTQLFFFVKMCVYEVLLLNSLLQWHRKTRKWGGYILLDKETTTGFYASIEGSSSALGIQLEKEVKLPVKYISEIFPDSAYIHPLSEIYNSTSLWNNGRVTYMSLPKHFRMSMEEYGLSPLKKNIKNND